ncbi:MAG: hypothetical protein OHK93_002285 [Ramalina farinacea]|uniref:Uncharacterized protein n=1 Tax=Ramalina farinacea TaxID=258253 RepID=A0AA43QSU6_9LECA|nr:hypothetical protein [Ramalina farinacea]
MSSTIENPPDCDMWLEAIDAKFYGKGEGFGREQWDQLLGHVTAVTDAPATAFAGELLEAYPDAKVIITTRSEAAWYRSMSGAMGSLYPELYSWRAAFIRLFDAAQRRCDGMMRRFIPAYWGPLKQVPACLKGRMTRHNDEVKQFIAEVEKKTGKKRRVLEYRVEEGWGPLCEFLGKDAPKDTPFPKINDLESFQALVAALRKMAFQRALQRAAFWCAGLIGLPACAWAVSTGGWTVR